MSRVAAVTTALVALVLAGCGGSAGETKVEMGTTPDDGWAGAALGEPRDLPDFALRDQEGELVRLSEQQGKVVVLTFIYTQCPDICPLMAENLSDAVKSLDPAKRDDVRILAVSVDPKGDTPANVRGYVKVHRLVPQFRYLIGSERELTEVWRKYDVHAVARDPDLVDHTAYTLLVDRSGQGIVLYKSDFTSGDVAQDLRRALAG